MVINNRRGGRELIKESSLMLEYSRVKSRTKRGEKTLWESVESLYQNDLLTEGSINEQSKIVNWLSKLGKDSIGVIRKFVKRLSGEEYGRSEKMAQEASNDPIGGRLKSLVKDGKWSEAFQIAQQWIDSKVNNTDSLQEGFFQDVGDSWRNMKGWKKTALVLGMLMIMFTNVTKGDSVQVDDVNQDTTEYSMDGQGVDDINDADFIFGDNTETPKDINVGGQSLESQGYETGVSFEFGSSDLDAEGQQQINDIANDYLQKIKAAQDNGDDVKSLEIKVKGGASNTGGSGWDSDNTKEGSLSNNRGVVAANALIDAIETNSNNQGVDLGGVDINVSSVEGMDSNELGGSENVKTGQKVGSQMAAFDGHLEHTPPVVDDIPSDAELGMNDYDMSKRDKTLSNVETELKGFKPSRFVEYYELLGLGGLVPPEVHSNYMSDSGDGSFDWRDVDIDSGDGEMADQKDMALWVVRQVKSKRGVLIRLSKVLTGVIDIAYNSDRYRGVIGTKHQRSTTVKLGEAELPSEPVKVESNKVTMWVNILGKGLTYVITPEVANEFDSNMSEVLKQLEYMYGNKLGRGDIGFKFRRNPSYGGSEYSNISTKWSDGSPDDTNTWVSPDEVSDGDVSNVNPDKQPVGGTFQDYTGDGVASLDGETNLVGSAPFNATDGVEVGDTTFDSEDLQEEIKKIKRLLN
tara:strand:- start:26142 stop:28208 length:2067 start_codon:yes stop_codon:yes gene_type:complete